MANKRRLIDANALSRQMQERADRMTAQGRYTPAQDHMFVAAVVDNAPTVDAVEVVRCKDCKYWEKHHYNYRTDGLCYCLHEYHDAERPMTEGDHYCAYGERRCE